MKVSKRKKLRNREIKKLMGEIFMLYDLIVIGGGPAGMMAAGRAGERGARVLLVERNPRLGVKLMITGKGRCNITNAEPDIRKFIAHYGWNGKFLFSAMSRFDNENTREFFEGRGVKTKVERGQRVFPESDQARDINDAFLDYLRESKVVIKTKATVAEVVSKNKRMEKIILSNGEELQAKNYLIATGGQSYPGTGSKGDAYQWLWQMGHKIIPVRPALAPIILKEDWIDELEGLSLKNVEISLWQNKKKVESRFGEALFTHEGMSGPVILDMSKRAGELVAQGAVTLVIDFKPALSEKILDERLQKDFTAQSNKMFKNSLDWLLPKKMIPMMVGISGIAGEKKVHTMTRAERQKLLKLLKSFPLEIKAVAGFETAIVTAGGVDLREVDPKTMKSRIIDNLFLAGEVLDLDGPTGGFNLQVCWSTGFVAGENIKT